MPKMTRTDPKTTASRWTTAAGAPLKISVSYALLGALWILASGWAVRTFIPDPATQALLENLKGWLFVIVTASLLWLSLNRYFGEIRHSAQRLQESEERWQFALETVEHGVWDWDLQRGTLFYSDRWKSMLGFAPNEVGSSLNEWESRVHPEDLPGARTEIEKHLQGSTSLYVAEYRLRCKDGSYKWILDQGRVLSRDPQGKPLRFLGTHSDITHRKEAEQVLAHRLELQDQFSKIVTTVPGMIYSFRLHPDGKASLPFATPVIEDLFGLRPEDVRDDFSPAFGRVHPDDRGPLMEGILESARNLKPWRGICRVQHPDHGELWLEGHSVPRREPDGSVLWHGFIQDVTARRRSEQALRESEERLRLALTAARQGLFDLNLITGAAVVSPEYATMLGHDPATFRETHDNWIERLHPDDREEVMRVYDDYINGRVPEYSVEFRQRTRAGDWKWILSMGKIVARSREGRPVRMMGTHTDITERKRLESQLRQAQKLEAIGQLAGGIAHDFNNILAATMMQLGLLQMGFKLDPEAQEILRDLDAQAKRASDLTRQLLMFSRRSVLSVKTLDLNQVVENLLKMLNRLIGEHIEIRFCPEPALPQIEADTGMLEQVVMNLVVNARDAMPDGGCIVIATSLRHVRAEELESEPRREPGPFVCLTVRDTGCGMDSATLKRIFEPFFTTKEAGKGTGLGLATVHGIVAQHKGWVEVDSELGKGSTFRVHLPAAPPTPTVNAPAPTLSTPQSGGERILLVEDEGKVRQLVASALRGLGYQVHEAASAREALRVWEEVGGNIDLVLTDMVMPEAMSGLELIKRLQELKPGLRAIISSGYSGDMVETGAPEQPGRVYLPKPYTAAQLADAVRRCLDYPMESADGTDTRELSS